MSWIALLCVLEMASAAPSKDEVRGVLQRFNESARYRFPALSDEQLDELTSGGTVKFRFSHTEGVDSAGALLLTDQPVQALWLASLDPHFTVKSGLTEQRLSATEHGAVWFGLLDLPFPFKDRCWVIETASNPKLVAATDNISWERSWKNRAEEMSQALSRAEAGNLKDLERSDLEACIVTPVNFGAWFYIDLGDGKSLLGYHAATVVGGNIPDSLVTRFVLAGLDELLGGVETRAREVVAGHYVEGHEPLRGGDGKVLPFFP